MAVDYTKLWKLLIDKKMNKSQLKEVVLCQDLVQVKMRFSPS